VIKTIILALLIVSSAHAVDLSTTPLGIAAAALQPGQSQKYDNASLLADVPWSDPRLFYYGDGAAWNDITQCVEFVPSPTGGTPRYLLQYCLGTDTWSAELTPEWGNGHGYDSAAAGPNGDLYFARYGGQVMRYQHATQAWTQLPNLPWQPGTVQSLTWFPGKGLVIVSANGRVALWDGAQWTSIPGAHAWGNTGAWSTLVGNVVYMGGYNSSLVSSVYRLDASLTLTQMPAPPILVGNAKSYQTTDGTDLLVAQANGAAWYRFDGAAWADAGVPASGAIKDKWSYYTTYIPALDVILTVGGRSSLREMWLVKVGPAEPPPPPPPDCYPPEQYKPMCPVAAVSADVCGQPGVVACDRFEGEPLSGSIVRASSGLTTPWVADGVLNMEMIKREGTIGAVDSGHYRLRLPAIGEGQMLAFTYAKRSDEVVSKFTGAKDLIIWGPHWAPSCTTQQLVVTHMYDTQVPILYRSCGLGIKTDLPDGDKLWQNGDFDCRYRAARAGRVAQCHTKKAGEWATYYTEIHVGKFGQPDSRAVVHVKTADGWRKMMDFPFTLPSNVPLEIMMLTNYYTNGTPVTSGGRVAFDNFIVATQPIDMALL
jgi:hypothetical protein